MSGSLLRINNGRYILAGQSQNIPRLDVASDVTVGTTLTVAGASSGPGLATLLESGSVSAVSSFTTAANWAGKGYARIIIQLYDLTSSVAANDLGLRVVNAAGTPATAAAYRFNQDRLSGTGATPTEVLESGTSSTGFDKMAISLGVSPTPYECVITIDVDGTGIQDPVKVEWRGNYVSSAGTFQTLHGGGVCQEAGYTKDLVNNVQFYRPTGTGLWTANYAVWGVKRV